MSEEARIESKAQFAPDAAGTAQRWEAELAAADKEVEEWHQDGDKVVKEFLGEGGKTRLNLYHSDTITKGAQLYGNIPKVRARRRFADANDDLARISAEALERLLNTDIEREDDGYREALANALSDWLKPGLGQVRLRYVVEWEDVPEQPAMKGPCRVCGGAALDPSCPCGGTGEVELAPAVPATKQKAFEDVETDHVNWKDWRWSPCRTWAEVRWGAVKAAMTKEEFTERFGEEKAARVQLDRRADAKEGSEPRDVWARVDVWEIWCKEDRKVYWHVRGQREILDVQDDPLGLPGFFPWPKPLAANTTTSKFIPKPTYILAEDLYEEAHNLTRRIRNLVKAVKAAGAYDKTNPELKRLLEESCENELIPVANWNALLEKGGLAGAMAFLPIEPFVKAIAELVQQRNLTILSLHQITGQSDLMRGQAEQKATATEQRIKARFGSTRIQIDQLELARFASDAQRIKAWIIAKHFDAATILGRANLADPGHPDAQKAPQAVEMLKGEFASYRIEVDAESLAMTDYDAVKQERVEFLQAMTTFLAESGKIAQIDPRALPFLLELGKHALAGFRGAQALEATFDKMIEAVKQPRPPAPPDPKLQAAQMKAKADAQKTQMDLQVAGAKHGMEMQRLSAEVQADRARTQNELAIAATTPQMPGGVL